MTLEKCRNGVLLTYDPDEGAYWLIVAREGDALPLRLYAGADRAGALDAFAVYEERKNTTSIFKR